MKQENYSWTAVATVLTVYGIETAVKVVKEFMQEQMLQQYLPFTVLKLQGSFLLRLPVIGSCNSTYRLRY